MLFEMRTYTLKQGTIGDIVKAAAEISTDIRGNDYGKLEGYWTTEIGPLNRVVHLWSYESYEERRRLRSELARNPRWNKEYMAVILPHLLRQDVRYMTAVRGVTAPASAPNFYEMRNYSCVAGVQGKWAELFTAALTAREKYSKIVGFWLTEGPDVNEVLHIWAYPDLNARVAARAGANKDPAWQQFLKDSNGMLNAMTSTIMLPAPHSPLK